MLCRSKEPIATKTMSRYEWTDEKLFHRLLNNRSKRTYWDNIRALRQRPTKEVFHRSIELTKSADPKAREIGIDVLAQLGTTPRPFCTESNKRFFEILDTGKDPQIFMSLLYAIGHNNERLTKMQIDKLCELGDTNNSLIKEGLVSSLLGIDHPRAIDTLIKLSSDKLDHIRDWATFGIGSQVERNNKKIREALWARVNDKHQDTKYEAIVGLAARKDTRVKEIIKRELLLEEYGTLLFEAIIAVGGKAFLPILRRHSKKERTNKDANPYWVGKLKDCINELVSCQVNFVCN
jgi:HEAT repeat protein